VRLEDVAANALKHANFNLPNAAPGGSGNHNAPPPPRVVFHCPAVILSAGPGGATHPSLASSKVSLASTI
jgi:hypothetical protein